MTQAQWLAELYQRREISDRMRAKLDRKPEFWLRKYWKNAGFRYRLMRRWALDSVEWEQSRADLDKRITDAEARLS
jgi:hypothetical protein